MRFTIVVPTRERCDTLASTLRTLTAQDRDDLSIVVSDNASEDATRDVVAAAGDPRVRYVNTGRRVSMTSNWEFGLSHVDDEPGNLVFYCGDDDGLLPGALDDLAALARETGARAVAWRKADYHWPSWAEAGWRNALVVPMENSLHRYDSAHALRDVARLWIPYYRLPALYNSVVDAAALHALRRREGRFFWSRIPDAYSGYAALAEIDWYLYSSRPFSVNGGSGHSTGASSGSTTNRGPYTRFLAEQDLPAHPKLKPIFGSVLACVMEALMQANDHAFGGRLEIHRALVVRGVFHEIQARSADVWGRAVEDLESFAREQGDRDLQRSIALFRALYPNRPSATAGARPAYGLTPHRSLVVDLESYGVKDIEGACQWTARLLGEYRAPPIAAYRSRDKLVARAGAWLSRRVPDWTL